MISPETGHRFDVDSSQPIPKLKLKWEVAFTQEQSVCSASEVAEHWAKSTSTVAEHCAKNPLIGGPGCSGSG